MKSNFERITLALPPIHRFAPADMEKASLRASALSTIILAWICAAAASRALRDPYTAANPGGMPSLGFPLTPAWLSPV